MLTADTKRRLDACRDILVGKLPLPTDQIELITLALIYKFMDDLDEESVKVGGKRSFFVGPLEKYRWRALLPQTVSAEERMNLFAEGIEAIGKAEHLPALFRDIFRNSFLKFRDGRILTLFLNEVNAFEYSHSEELGNAFEYLLKTMGIQAENGQFRTPRHIINFMVECLDPQPNDRILDPACGTGGFLVSAYKHILAQHTSPGSKIPGDKLTHDQRQKVYSNLTGYDVTDLMVKLSKVNLFLHGFPDPAIHIYDTLTNDARWNEKADLILANPPFMTPKGGVSPHTKFRVSAKKSEVLFTDYIAEHLTPDGRGAVIVPNGIVATTQNAYIKLRRFLVEDSLVAIVSLPAGVFKPYSGVKTSILFLDKKLSRKIENILFLKITADGFDLGDQRRPISENDLPEAQCIVKAWLKRTVAELGETTVKWTTASKSGLLAQRHCSLQAEPFFGEQPTKSDFEIVRLGDVAEIISGQSPPGDSYNESGNGLPLYQGKADFGDIWLEPPRVWTTNPTKRALRDDVLMSVRAPVGPVNLCPQEICIGRGLAAIRPGESLIRDYLFYFLRNNQNRIRGADGAVFPSISREQIASIQIPLPSLEQQQQIVSDIQSYQKVIDGARQILTGYKVRINAEPEWPVQPLSEAAEIIGGYAFKSTEMKRAEENGNLPVVKIGNVGRDGRLDLTDIQYHVLTPDLSRFLLHTGDIVIAMTGATVGKVAEVNRDNLLLNQRVGVLRRKQTAEQKYLLHLLRSPEFYDFCQRTAGGGAQGNIAPRQILDYEIPLPSLEQQRSAVAATDAELSQMEAIRELIPKFETKIQRVLDRVWGGDGPD
jgi:type I restriction enzyme M protein